MVVICMKVVCTSSFGGVCVNLEFNSEMVSSLCVNLFCWVLCCLKKIKAAKSRKSIDSCLCPGVL